MKVLYILMRTDMASMNPGKAMAQASHATSCFHRLMENTTEMVMAKNGGHPKGIAADYMEWLAEAAYNFGTVLTLAVTEAEMREVIMYADQFEMPNGVVTDPTYPLRDGAVTHYLAVDTCAWIFAEKEDAQNVLGWLQLHP